MSSSSTPIKFPPYCERSRTGISRTKSATTRTRGRHPSPIWLRYPPLSPRRSVPRLNKIAPTRALRGLNCYDRLLHLRSRSAREVTTSKAPKCPRSRFLLKTRLRSLLKSHSQWLSAKQTLRPLQSYRPAFSNLPHGGPTNWHTRRINVLDLSDLRRLNTLLGTGRM